MKKYLLLILAVLLPLGTVSGKKKVKQNIQVWGEVKTAEDGFEYLTMYKNCPAEVTAQFHFVFYDKTESVVYDLVMPDSVAEVRDPEPVEKPVDEVVLDKIIYSTLQDDGTVYRTDDPDDPLLAVLLVDMFDLYYDLFLFDVAHLAHYYHNNKRDDWVPSSGHRSDVPRSDKSKSPDVDKDKLDNAALLLGVAAVAAASLGMLIAISDNLYVEDDRFPYFSISPQAQYYVQTGTVREVVQMKYRVGERGGFSLMADMGRTTGSLNYPEIFNPGLTWSVGAGMDLGAFSISFHFKPTTKHQSEHFLNCQLGYDIFMTKNLAVDLRTGIGVFSYNDDLYADVPLSLGLLWKF